MGRFIVFFIPHFAMATNFSRVNIYQKHMTHVKFVHLRWGNFCSQSNQSIFIPQFKSSNGFSLSHELITWSVSMECAWTCFCVRSQPGSVRGKLILNPFFQPRVIHREITFSVEILFYSECNRTSRDKKLLMVLHDFSEAGRRRSFQFSYLIIGMKFVD